MQKQLLVCMANSIVIAPGLMLTARQAAFAKHYLLEGNATEAARQAGYSTKTARQMAAENLTKPAVIEAIERLQAENAAKLELTREDVLNGLLEAVKLAKEQANPVALVSAWREIGRVIGCYQPEVRRVELSAEGKALQYRYAGMSDEELLEIISRH